MSVATKAQKAELHARAAWLQSDDAVLVGAWSTFMQTA